tara:strand:- start:1032 stop:1565 length:534 start_codon:yes stop_codon:yes gene_type:complete
MINYIKKRRELYRVSEKQLRTRDNYNPQRDIIKYGKQKSYIFRFFSIFSWIIPPIIFYIAHKLDFRHRDLEGNRIIEIKLKYLESSFNDFSTIKEISNNTGSISEDFKDYNWDLLKESIKKYKNILPLTVRVIEKHEKYMYKSNKIYKLADGNHRYMVLKDLYGENYKVKAGIIGKR